MDIVELQPVIERPPLEEPEASDRYGEPIIVLYVDWLMTTLAAAGPAELIAEQMSGAKTVLWHLRQLDSEDPARVIETTKQIYFRMILARIAIGYMGGNPYGGYRRFHLATPTAKHRAIFHLSNENLGGFWFRARCSSAVPAGQ